MELFLSMDSAGAECEIGFKMNGNFPSNQPQRWEPTPTESERIRSLYRRFLEEDEQRKKQIRPLLIGGLIMIFVFSFISSDPVVERTCTFAFLIWLTALNFSRLG